METTKSLTAPKRRFVNPACSICEDEGRVTVTLEMPGVRKEDLEIKIEGNELVVLGKRTESVPDGTFLVRERRSGDFRKTFTLDESIDHEGVDGRLADGVLILSLKIKEAALPRKISIR